ncbi:ParA family protein [Glacieibacterium frigidum]|uniref:ParA family protein n=1 Tax=Glacieibacterium frigidum TaxID=2593303 RepID=A0A552UJ55_9SPHN|nr:ParA family protein [Glacieibacterium frigidum]TRW18214.1 ParA family protein [Glacieibacterium frigidum]
MKSVAVFSVKGGVGKTALAVNLAYASATLSARRTLLWDLDAQGAATFTLKLAPKGGAAARKLFAKDAALDAAIQPSAWPCLDLLAADGSLRSLEKQLATDDKAKRLRRMLKDLDGDYDRIVLDCPPGLSELAEQLFRAVDLLVVPMIPSPLSIRAYEQLVAHLARHHPKGPAVVPVFTMVDRRRALHRNIVDVDADRAAIPYASAVEAMSVHRSPIAVRAPGGPAARAFNGLWADIERRLVSQG